MADITTRTDEQHQQGVQFALKMGAEKIVEGALVSVNSSGYAVNAGDDAGAVFAGVAQETVDNSAGAAGDTEIVVRSGGIVQLGAAFSAAQTNVGDEVTLSDNHTVDVAGTTTNDVVCGRIQKVVSSSVVRVALYPFGSKR
jgi:hypothetical protein